MEEPFLDRIAHVPLLTARDERRLAARIARGDRAARERMIEANLRLVVYLARRVRREGHPLTLMDLVQEGTIGLVRAVERFDHRRGVRFSTYAAWWIRQAMLQAVQEHGAAVRLSGPAVRRARDLRRARQELTALRGRGPTTAELAGHLGCGVEDVEALERAAGAYVPLDEGHAVPDTAAPLHDGAALEERRRSLAVALERLRPRERRVLALRFGLDGARPLTAREAAAQLGTSAGRVRHAEDLALRRLRAQPGIGALLPLDAA